MSTCAYQFHHWGFRQELPRSWGPRCWPRRLRLLPCLLMVVIWEF